MASIWTAGDSDDHSSRSETVGLVLCFVLLLSFLFLLSRLLSFRSLSLFIVDKITTACSQEGVERRRKSDSEGMAFISLFVANGSKKKKKKRNRKFERNRYH
jgi:hypothetical protein